MAENESESETRIWSDLIPDLVSVIAEKLDLIDLLALRATCQSWRLASFQASAKLKESILHQMPPWFLCQKSYDNSECFVHDLRTKSKYRMNLPQLKGTKILGSFQGWLLLFNSGGGKIFFFCPFTLDKISLPDLPQSEICLHTKAALTSSPTSITDRTILLIWREENPLIFFHYILQPGSQSWNKGEISCNIDIMKATTGVAYNDGKFILFNRDIMGNKARSLGIEIEPIIINQENKSSNIRISMQSYLELKYVREWLSMDDEDDHEEDQNSTTPVVYVWGTHWQDGRMGMSNYFVNESNIEQTMFPNLSQTNLGRRGIWIHPRLFTSN